MLAVVLQPAHAQLLEILNTVKTATDTFNAVSGVVGKVAPVPAPGQAPSAPAGNASPTLPVGPAGDSTDEPKLLTLSGTQKTSLEQKQSFCVNGTRIAAFPYEGDYQGVAFIMNINGSERIIPIQSTDKNQEGHHALWKGTVHIGQINGYQFNVSKLDSVLFNFELTKPEGYKKTYMTKIC